MLFRNVVYIRSDYPPSSSNLGLKENTPNKTAQVKFENPKTRNIWSSVGKSLCLHFLTSFKDTYLIIGFSVTSMLRENYYL